MGGPQSHVPDFLLRHRMEYRGRNHAQPDRLAAACRPSLVQDADDHIGEFAFAFVSVNGKPTDLPTGADSRDGTVEAY